MGIIEKMKGIILRSKNEGNTGLKNEGETLSNLCENSIKELNAYRDLPEARSKINNLIEEYNFMKEQCKNNLISNEAISNRMVTLDSKKETVLQEAKNNVANFVKEYLVENGDKTNVIKDFVKYYGPKLSTLQACIEEDTRLPKERKTEIINNECELLFQSYLNGSRVENKNKVIETKNDFKSYVQGKIKKEIVEMNEEKFEKSYERYKRLEMNDKKLEMKENVLNNSFDDSYNKNDDVAEEIIPTRNDSLDVKNIRRLSVSSI